MMEMVKIVKYLTRNAPSAEGGYMLQDDNDGNGVFIAEWFSPMLGDQPTDDEMLAVEADAIAWFDAQTEMTYGELFRLLPRSVRVDMTILKDSLKESSEASDKLTGYTLDDIERDIRTDQIYNDGDTAQRTIFNDIRAVFVSASVITQAQSDTWGTLEVVTI